MRSRINAGLVLLTAAVITYLSLKPALPAQDAVGEGTFQFGHFLLYFLLAGALLLHFHDTPRGHIEAVLAAGTFGVLIELAQLAVPVRTFSAADIAVNFLGAAVVLLDHRARVVTYLIEKEDALIERYLL